MELDFNDLAPREIPFKYAGKSYLLREASEQAACKYRNALARATKFVDGKPSQIGDIADAEPIIVAECVFEKYQHQGDEKIRPVLLKTVLDWPARVVGPLFRKVKEISELEEEETQEVLEARLRETQKKLTELLLKREREEAEKASATGETHQKNSLRSPRAENETMSEPNTGITTSGLHTTSGKQLGS